jgi:hypothetical protein
MAGMCLDSSLLLVGDRYRITGDWLSASWQSIWTFWTLPSMDLKQQIGKAEEIQIKKSC